MPLYRLLHIITRDILHIMSEQPKVYTSFHVASGTWQYLVADPQTHDAVIIDPALDFNPATQQISSENADQLLDLATTNGLKINRIMETHAHADHLTAARYLQQKLLQLHQPRPDICIGKRITEVQSRFAQRYGIEATELKDVFDHLFSDGEQFSLGGLTGEVLHLPGHTPDHVGYKIGDNIFTGDSIFNPDVGSARCDFPGGSATDLYRSMNVLLSLPGHYRLYVGHDYPPESRPPNEAGEKHQPYTTVREQAEFNKHVKSGTPQGDFVKWRTERDATLAEPKLLHQSLQFNIRAGRMPRKTHNGDRLLHVPVKASADVMAIMGAEEAVQGVAEGAEAKI
jgi:glyoxylase-like metal-dependent hydrolase (beta-lactamase superfamily II)